MPDGFRVISFNDLRDALEALIEIEISDDELRERGIVLTERGSLMDGLGLSSYTLIELATKEQYLLQRLEHKPETLNISASLDESPTPLVERFVAALDVAKERIKWAASDEFWNEARVRYDRAKWLEQRQRLG